MPREQVLIQIVTAANMAGVTEAKAGFLGMTPAVLGAGMAIAGLVFISKQSIENTKAQQTAILDLTQAVDAYNSHLGKNAAAHKVFIAGTAASAKGAAALKIAHEKLTIATQELTLAEDKYHRAVYMFGPQNDKTLAAKIRVENATLRLAAAEKAAGASGGATAAHYKNVAATHKLAAISLDDYKAKVEAFISTNKRYIANQYDALTAAGNITRAGRSEKDSLRLLNDALDLAVIKHEDITAAAKTLILAESGNARGLKELGITTQQYNTIMKGKGTIQQKDAALLKLIEQHTKDGRKAVDDLSASQQALNTDWQNFTTRIAPGVVDGLDHIYTAEDRAVVITDLLAQGLSKDSTKFLSGALAQSAHQLTDRWLAHQNQLPKPPGAPPGPGNLKGAALAAYYKAFPQYLPKNMAAAAGRKELADETFQKALLAETQQQNRHLAEIANETRNYARRPAPPVLISTQTIAQIAAEIRRRDRSLR